MRIIDYVLKSLTKKPFTNLFPKSKQIAYEGYRGTLIYEREKCIGCQSCVRVCPSHAILFKEKGKKVEFNMGRCVYCGSCVDVCPVKCISFKKEFLNAEVKKENLIVK